MDTNRGRSLTLKSIAIAALAILLAQSPALVAQPYPAKPIRHILTVAGGGETNARYADEKLSQLLGVPIVVETQAGAGGAVGAMMVARAAPDGYTLLYGTTGPMVMREFLVKDPSYHLLKDFTPIAQLGNATGAIAATNSLPANSLKELIAYAKANPGKVSYGSTGTGSTHHLSGVMIGQMTGTDMLHVPYKGASQFVTDLMTGRIQIAFTTMSTFVPLLNSGKIKLLAINEERGMPQYPNVPTVFEVLPGYDRVPSWFGYLGPAGLPQPIVQRLSSEIMKVGAMPDVVEKLGSVGSFVNPLPADKFGAELKKQIEIAGRLTKSAGIELE
jgi:tripartite-type tricarboxylate transporter receptor subunit TctC